MRTSWFVLGMLVTSQSAGATPPSYVDVINDGDESVTSIEVATPGSIDWHPVTVRGVMDGGYVSLVGGYVGRAKVRIDTAHGCVYDVLIQFAAQKALLVKGFDVCRTHSLHIGHAWWQAHARS